LKDSANQDLGLRVIWEGRQATVSTSDFTKDAIAQLVDDAVELARATSVDDRLSLPEQSEFARDWPELDLYDRESANLSTDKKLALALEAEEAARSFDQRIVNFDGSSFDSVSGGTILANSLGFVGFYQGTHCSVSTVPIAQEDGKMQRDYWFDTKRKVKDLENATSIGRKAAERTIRRLGAKKIKTQQVPVVFDPVTATSLLSNIFQAVSGDSIIRKSSFLLGKLEEVIASQNLTVVDDGRIPGAVGSRPFDGEGLPTRRNVVIEKGRFKTYLLNSYTARKLGMKSTGNAVRGISSAPSVGSTNLYVEPGSFSPEEIIRSVKNGFYLTDLIGFGVNIVTGDYSRGASGIWIENGELTYPVEEVTIAGNLKDMLKAIEMVGSDLEFRARSASPTIKIGSMTVSGE
jgi:PmbA protein